MRDDLRWWADFAPGFNGQTLIPHKIHKDSLWTDASIKGFGALCGCDWLAGEWDGLRPLPNSSLCNHICPPPELDGDDRQNISMLELWAVVASLERWAHKFRNYSIRLFSDNMQVVHMIRNSASINKPCMNWLRRIFWAAMNNNIRVKPEYIPSEDNTAADCLSRLPYVSRLSELLVKLSIFDICCYDVLKNSLLCRIDEFKE